MFEPSFLVPRGHSRGTEGYIESTRTFYGREGQKRGSLFSKVVCMSSTLKQRPSSCSSVRDMARCRRILEIPIRA